MSAVLEVRGLSFAYRTEAGVHPVLDNVDLEVARGEWVAILGRSGSGKSTLLYLLSGLISADEGQVLIDGQDLGKLNASGRALFRSRHIGFVFQQFHLLAKATAWQNLMLPLRFPTEAPRWTKEAETRAHSLAEKLGITQRLDRAPNQLSGGEQQRVAIARALVPNPSLILADEPTGNLDEANAKETLRVIRSLQSEGATIVMITHDEEVAAAADRTMRLEKGKLVGPGPTKSIRAGAVREWAKPESGSLKSSFRTVIANSIDNLRRNRTRTALTMVGVVLGVASLFSMLTFGSYARDQIVASFEEMGTDTIFVEGWPNWRRKASDRVKSIFWAFDVERDLEAMRRVFPEVRRYSPYTIGNGYTVSYSGRTIQTETQVVGVDAEFLRIGRRALASGRHMTPLHVARATPVCIIGDSIQDELFGEAPPVGKMIFLTANDGTLFPCQVIGALEKSRGSTDGHNPGYDVLLPYTYFQKVADQWSARIRIALVQLESGSDVERISGGIKRWYESRYGSSGRFNIDGNAVLIAQMKRSLRLFGLLLAAIALVTLAVGAIGIHNMMLVSLSERFKELGLYKALGATDRSIRLQLLGESTSIAIFAGFLGLLLGFTAYEGILYLAAKVVPRLTFQWILDPTAFVFSIVSIGLVGVVSGIVPAIRAERLTVVEALRSE